MLMIEILRGRLTVVNYNFLVLAEELGHPRREWQTPKEHQRTLGWLLPRSR
jgi:hypothetical protein